VPGPLYSYGQHHALHTLGLTKEAKGGLLMRARKSPYEELSRRFATLTKLKVPKFDISALLKRLLNNPLKQPRLHLSGKGPALKV